MADDNSTLFDLAEKQDRFEHEYSSTLVTRIGLFLVFAGFISGFALELLKLILADNPKVLSWHSLSSLLLGISIVLLFAAIVILLRAALMPGYSVPGLISKYRNHYKELLDYNGGDADKAHRDLRDSIIDATAEAVDKNSERNSKRADVISWASGLLLLSTISLFLALGAFLVHVGRRACLASVDRPQPTAVGVANAPTEKSQQGRVQEMREIESNKKAKTPCQ